MKRTTIPKKIKEKIRQNCGFGCIICGEIFTQIEHIDEYSKVKCHEESNMVLLCHKHHGEVTNGIRSKDEIRKYQQNPFSLQPGNKAHSQIIPSKGLDIEFYNIKFTGIPIICMYNFAPLIWFERSSAFSPLSLNINFYYNNYLIFKIEENILELLDIDTSAYIEGNTFFIHHQNNKVLEFSFQHNIFFKINYIDFQKDNYKIKFPQIHPELNEEYAQIGSINLSGLSFAGSTSSRFTCLLDTNNPLPKNIIQFYEIIIKNEKNKNEIALNNKNIGTIINLNDFNFQIQYKIDDIASSKLHKLISTTINENLSNKHNIICISNYPTFIIKFLPVWI